MMASSEISTITRRTAWTQVSTLHACFAGYGYFICGNANSTPALAVFGQRCITALCRV